MTPRQEKLYLLTLEANLGAVSEGLTQYLSLCDIIRRLREEKRIYITINPGAFNMVNPPYAVDYNYSIYHNGEWKSLDHRDGLDTYEEAIIVAIETFFK